MAYCDFLKNSEVFNVLEEPECEAIAELAEEREIKKGSVLGKENQPAEEFFLVLEGELDITVNAALTEALPISIATVGPGKISAWSAMYPDGKLTASIRAAKDTRLLVWKTSELHDYLMRNCGMGYRILEQLLAVVARRLTNTRVGLMSCVMDNT